MKKIIFLFACALLQFSLNAQTLPNSFTDGKYITVNGAKLYVVLAGKGEPLIIIPGGPGNSHFRIEDLIRWQITIHLFILMPLEEANLIQQRM